MPSFSITVREHTYTGRFYHDVVEAESAEQALQLAATQAAVPKPPPGSTPRSFSVTVREQTDTENFRHDVVEAESGQEALTLAAVQAAAPRPPPVSEPKPAAAIRRRCDDVWVYPLLRCGLVEGHDPPHMAVAGGYRRLMRWARDDRGIAHAVPGPTGLQELPGHGGAARNQVRHRRWRSWRTPGIRPASTVLPEPSG
jgi:hypothetical protein